MSDKSGQCEPPARLSSGSNRPDSRIINGYRGLCCKLMGKIPKSSHKRDDAASPAQGS